MSTAPTAAATPVARFPEYTTVVLTHDVLSLGVRIPAGSAGVIVHCHRDGIGYEVEFTQPAFRVVTLTAGDLEMPRG
jgi:hypothetical protein